MEKSKFFCLVLIILASLTACNKRNNPTPDLVIDRIEESLSSPINSNVQVKSWDFEYDDRQRITRVGDRYFYYGNNGKVVSAWTSRIENRLPSGRSEYLEKLSFHWDASSGRLTQIVADTLHHRSFQASGALDYESLKLNIVVARYFYEAGSARPNLISYLRDYHLIGGGVYEEDIHLGYSGNNVLHARVLGAITAPPGVPTTPSTIEAHYHFRYSDHKNHLYLAYEQLGFHPYNFNTVVSQNQPTQVYAEAVPVGQPLTSNTDWEKADKFTYQFNDQGQTIWVKRSPLRPYEAVMMTTISYKEKR